MNKNNSSRLKKVEDTIIALESRKTLKLEEKKQLDRLYEKLEILIGECK
jgi:hypothetical protein